MNNNMINASAIIDELDPIIIVIFISVSYIYC